MYMYASWPRGRHGSVMVSVLDSGLNSLGLSPFVCCFSILQSRKWFFNLHIMFKIVFTNTISHSCHFTTRWWQTSVKRRKESWLPSSRSCKKKLKPTKKERKTRSVDDIKMDFHCALWWYIQHVQWKSCPVLSSSLRTQRYNYISGSSFTLQKSRVGWKSSQKYFCVCRPCSVRWILSITYPMHK